MTRYKRNQIEEAISIVLDPNYPKELRTIRTQVKRLLETDRALHEKRASRGSKGSKFAFYTGLPPGTGTEVWFSEYEGFALLIGLCLMLHHWPQSFVVAVLRQVRPELEKEHSRLLLLDPKLLFDQKAYQKRVAAGETPFDNEDPVLVTIVSRRGLGKGEQTEPIACAIKRGMAEAMKFANRIQPVAGAAWSFLDVTPSAHLLSWALARTKPRARGRS